MKIRAGILIDFQAETRSQIEKNIPKVITCLRDSDPDVQKAALNAVECLGQYCE
jgi:hypothetical protein